MLVASSLAPYMADMPMQPKPMADAGELKVVLVMIVSFEVNEFVVHKRYFIDMLYTNKYLI